MVRLAPQHVDRTGGLIVIGFKIREQGSSNRISDPSPGIVLVKGSLEGAHKHVALSAIVENDTKSRIPTTLGIREHFANVCNVGLLSTNDKPSARADFGFELERTCLAHAASDFLLHLLEQWFEPVEVLAFLPVGDFLGRLFVGGRTDMLNDQFIC
jgi:hypothetical protein